MPLSRAVDDYVSGRGSDAYAAVREAGFNNGSDRLEANRELAEWMRRYNADSSHRIKVRFYGFDIPGMGFGPTSPRETLYVALDALATIAAADAAPRRRRIDLLLGPDARWQNPMDWRDPAKSTGLVAAANALRVETEDLLVSLRTRRPELVARVGQERSREAEHYAAMAREHLGSFVVLANEASFAGSLGVRDALMADNLAYIVARERGRGKVLAFAHNTHLQRGEATMAAGGDIYRWWSAGSQLNELFELRYAVIGSAVGISEANGIGEPQAGTFEALLTAAPGPVRLIPTYRGQRLPAAEIAALPPRAGSRNNPSYVTPLNPQSFTDFDWLVALDAVSYSCGGPWLQP